MQVDYRRDLYSNCLVLSEEGQPDLSSYQVRMLMANELQGFLPCRVHQMDGKLLFYYDITSRQSLETMFAHQKISAVSLEKILKGLVEGLDTVKNYLLNPDGLLFNPKFIYTDPDQKQIWFCYLPGNTEPFVSQLKTFSEFLLPRLDNCDRRGVVMGYAFYQLTVRGSITAEEIQALLHSPGETEPDSRRDAGAERKYRVDHPDRAEAWEKERVPGTREELLESFFADDEEEKTETDGKKRAVLAAAGIAAGGIIGITAWLNCLVWGIAAAGVLAVSGWFVYRHFRTGQEEESQARIHEAATFRETVSTEEEPEESVCGEPVQEEEGTDCLSGTAEEPRGCLIPLSPGGLEPIRLEQEVITVGKSWQNANIILKSPAVSRIHARLIWEGEGYRISDLNSRNGTWVNHILLKPEESEELKDGDEIRFADLTYLYRK